MLLWFQYRHNLFAAWCHHLTQAGLSFRPDIALTEYLSNPDDRLRWQANALPTDDLCTENAIMLKVCCLFYERALVCKMLDFKFVLFGHHSFCLQSKYLSSFQPLQS